LAALAEEILITKIKDPIQLPKKFIEYFEKNFNSALYQD